MSYSCFDTLYIIEVSESGCSWLFVHLLRAHTDFWLLLFPWVCTFDVFMSCRKFDVAFLDIFPLQHILQVLKRRKYGRINTKMGAMGSGWGHFVIFLLETGVNIASTSIKNHDKGNLLHNTVWRRHRMYFQGRYCSILDHAFGSNFCVFVLCHRPSQMLRSCPHS